MRVSRLRELFNLAVCFYLDPMDIMSHPSSTPTVIIVPSIIILLIMAALTGEAMASNDSGTASYLLLATTAFGFLSSLAAKFFESAAEKRKRRWELEDREYLRRQLDHTVTKINDVDSKVDMVTTVAASALAAGSDNQKQIDESKEDIQRNREGIGRLDDRMTKQEEAR